MSKPINSLIKKSNLTGNSCAEKGNNYDTIRHYINNLNKHLAQFVIDAESCVDTLKHVTYHHILLVFKDFSCSMSFAEDENECSCLLQLKNNDNCMLKFSHQKMHYFDDIDTNYCDKYNKTSIRILANAYRYYDDTTFVTDIISLFNALHTNNYIIQKSNLITTMSSKIFLMRHVLFVAKCTGKKIYTSPDDAPDYLFAFSIPNNDYSEFYFTIYNDGTGNDNDDGYNYNYVLYDKNDDNLCSVSNGKPIRYRGNDIKAGKFNVDETFEMLERITEYLLRL